VHTRFFRAQKSANRGAARSRVPTIFSFVIPYGEINNTQLPRKYQAQKAADRRGLTEGTGDCNPGGEEAPDGYATIHKILSGKEKVDPNC
jgi:hypothetical protein